MQIERNIIKIGLTPNQMKIHRDQSRLRIALCGRGFGKSYTAAVEMINFAANHANCRVAYVAITYNQAKEIMMPELDKLIPSYILKKFTKSPPMYELTNGSKISLYGANNPETFRGPQCDFFVLDEAASQESFIYTEIFRPAIAKTNGKGLLIGTKKGIGNWVSDLALTPQFSTHIYTSAEGGIMSLDEIEMLRQELDEQVFNQEILSLDVSHTGLAYYQFSKDCYSEQVFSPLADTVISFDFNVNPMTAVLFQRNEDNYLGYVAVNEFMHYSSNSEDTAKAIKLYLAGQGFKGNLQICGDFAGGHRDASATYTSWQILDGYFKSYSGFQSKHRRTITIVDRVHTHNQAMKQGLVKFNPVTCPKTCKEHGRMEWKDNGVKLNDKGGTMGHITDAACYFSLNHFPLIKTKTYSR